MQPVCAPDETYMLNAVHGWGYGSMVELSTPNRKVAGSIPVGLKPTIFSSRSSAVYFLVKMP